MNSSSSFPDRINKIIRYIKLRGVQLLLREMFDKRAWKANQFFDFDIARKDGHIMAFQALHSFPLANTKKMAEDAEKWVKEIVQVLKTGSEQIKLKINGFNICVYYFDRTSFLWGNTCLYNAFIKNGKIVSIDPQPIEINKSKYTATELKQIEMLQSYPLEASQFFIPYYNKNKQMTQQNSSDILCLVNIRRNYELRHLGKKSKQQFLALNKRMIPGGPFKRIVIKFQEPTFLGHKTFTYKVKMPV